jgi:hypothetical protein
MDITFAKGSKRFTPEQWLRRCQRLLQLSEPPPVLLDFLMQEFTQDGDGWSIEEEVPVAVIELRKT